MNSPYIIHDNIFFVPIIPARLNFAVLVQRAVAELEYDRKDFVIAVALPASIEKKVREAIKKLPTVSLIVAELGKDFLGETDEREVFSITPADGMIEAVRIAEDKGIPLYYIDNEIPPGHLLLKHCIRIPDWPDDSLVLELGAKGYLDLVKGIISHQPARFEPVDTWREIHMANQLRILHTRYRPTPILFICDTIHIEPIRKLLPKSMQLTDSIEDVLPPIKYEIMPPSSPNLLRYLDDMPKLVEMYEHYRKDNRVKDFDKKMAIFEAIRQAEEEAEDFNFAAHHYQAFTELIGKVAESSQRLSPELEHVVDVAARCFNRRFSKRLRQHLLSYFNQVNFDRVGRLLSPDTEDPTPKYKYRRCNPLQRIYETLPHKNDSNSAFLPQYKHFLNRMRAKAHKLTVHTGRRSVSSEFRGSIESGIDFRATLKDRLRYAIMSHSGVAPHLYVKRCLRSNTKHIDECEPVVWLIDVRLKEKIRGNFLWFGNFGGPRYVAQWMFTLPRALENENEKENARIYSYQRMGMVSFCKAAVTLEKIRGEYGVQFAKRIPKEKDLVELPSIGYVLSDLVKYTLRRDIAWWELLLLGALKYANRTVTCVAPIEFSITTSILALAQEQGKSFSRIPLSIFSPDEQRRLGKYYALEFEKFVPDDKDVNDPYYLAIIEDRFKELMRPYLN